MQSFCKTTWSSWRLIQLFGELSAVLQEMGWGEEEKKKPVEKNLS